MQRALIGVVVAAVLAVAIAGFDLRFAPLSSAPGADLGILAGREGKLVIPDDPQPAPNPAAAIRY